ncbi:MAG: amidophosphoribosyltransferase [Clostridia bacterium]|nr:amidophosphoribosyltransferase [Clostridia bacterium]
MGGFFGAVGKQDVIWDVFFGVDYHSHLGTRRGGMACFSNETGFERSIHSIENAPFRTKFEEDVSGWSGRACIGCISDSDPQPLLIRSNLGVYAISAVGRINNADQLIAQYLTFSGGHFTAMAGGKINMTELIAALINQKKSFAEGIRFAQEAIDGTANILILTEQRELIAARDLVGRLPVVLGKKDGGFCVSFEDFAMYKLGYERLRELGPGEVVRLTENEAETLLSPEKKKRICAFLWTYYGYPNAVYEGLGVEIMRMRNGTLLARADRSSGRTGELDYVCGVPDSGIPHAIGYANESHIPYARPFIKYTPTWPRSFMPANQEVRNQVAKMKQIPVHDLINGKRLLFVDDSIVRGTQLRETVEFLYANGAKEVHMRSACPPILFGCRFLNFSRNTSESDLIARRTISQLEGEDGLAHLDEYRDGSTERGRKLREVIGGQLKLTTLEYQTMENVLEAIGLPEDEVCTYCWTGKD